MKKKSYRNWALIVVFLLGIIATILSRLNYFVIRTPWDNILLSVGCSLIATVISTIVLTIGDTSSIDNIQNTLSAIGIDVDLYKRNNKALSFPASIKKDDIVNAAQTGLNQFLIRSSFSVGHTVTTKLDYYYDLIGATCKQETAAYFARILSSFWAQSITIPGEITNPDFDFVVTPKGGSPILGYEFAKLVNKPFVLHESSQRFQDKIDDMRSWFDCDKVPSSGQTALIVDDSTTGGTMIVETVRHLRQYKYKVHTCLVVFTPVVKNAKSTLNNYNIQLISILKTHEKTTQQKADLTMPEQQALQSSR